MARSSILGGETAPARASGNDVDALGPSNSSDSGSDVQGERPMATAPDNQAEWGAVVSEHDSDSDATGTGERASAAGDGGRDNADILPDRIVTPGLGGTSTDALGDVGDIAGEDGESLDEAIEGTGDDDDAV
ncbi:hypothetical protein [Pseudorhodoferax sp. Leaf267]|uniref:hypothetical protein n=1 Tax=Pseudorhodoferax sp. Leaf267 TaxID=1736316 RepID=UPI0006F48F3F|nr:hypothetical protein [Pseudorhodoferax sp. Leaf267]KQP17765.1 hypothetical protein ASF43_07775 [Pseudorhodoferax sp. Leaf267]